MPSSSPSFSALFAGFPTVALEMLRGAKDCTPLASMPHLNAACDFKALHHSFAAALEATPDISAASSALELYQPFDAAGVAAAQFLLLLAKAGRLEELRSIYLSSFVPVPAGWPALQLLLASEDTFHLATDAMMTKISQILPETESPRGINPDEAVRCAVGFLWKAIANRRTQHRSPKHMAMSEVVVVAKCYLSHRQYLPQRHDIDPTSVCSTVKDITFSAVEMRQWDLAAQLVRAAAAYKHLSQDDIARVCCAAIRDGKLDTAADILQLHGLVPTVRPSSSNQCQHREQVRAGTFEKHHPCTDHALHVTQK
jgi:hypothetical protein